MAAPADRLQDLWAVLTNTTLPQSLPVVSQKLEACRKVLGTLTSDFSRLKRNEATTITAAEIEKLSKSATASEVPDDLLPQWSALKARLIQTLYLDIRSTEELVKGTAESRKESVATYLAKDLESACTAVLQEYFLRRRLIIGIQRYIQESTLSLGSGLVHPYHELMADFVDGLKNSVEFHDSLLSEYGFILSRMKDHAESPDVSGIGTTWLTLQLQELRDLGLLAFDLCGHIAKDKKTIAAVFDPLITCGPALERLPIPSGSGVASSLMELSQQVTLVLSGFVFRYVAIGLPFFLRSEDCRAYLDEAFPSAPNLVTFGPSSVLYLTSRMEADPASQSTVEQLNKVLVETNPFSILALLMRSEVFKGSMKVTVVGLVNDMGEQVLRLSGIEGLGGFLDNFYDLAAGVFHHPKEFNRFWQRWSEFTGTDIQYAWGLLFSYARDNLPRTCMKFVPVLTSLLKAATVVDASIAAKLIAILWNLDSFLEELLEDKMQEITVLRVEKDGVAVVRAEKDRHPFGLGILKIPKHTMGWMTTTNRSAELRWVLHGQARYSIWTVCAVHVETLLLNLKYTEKLGAVLEDVVSISRLYCTAVKAESSIHADLQQLLVLLCRILGGILRLAMETRDFPILYTSICVILDLSSVEMKFRGVQFLHDINLIAPVFPTAADGIPLESDWIRNGNFDWFNPFWRDLYRHLSKNQFAQTLGKLAGMLQSLVQNSKTVVTDSLVQQCNVFLLNIGLRTVIQLEEVTKGTDTLTLAVYCSVDKKLTFTGRPLLTYILAVFKTETDSEPQISAPTLANVAGDCLYEGPAGQALLELLNRGYRSLKSFINNDVPTAVSSCEEQEHTKFVQLLLEVLYILLDRLPIRSPDCVTALERSLLSTEKSRHVQTVSVSNVFRDPSSRPKHPTLQLCRFIAAASDAIIVQYAAASLSRLIVLQQPSLLTIAKDDVEMFMKTIFRLLSEGNSGVVVELWKFLALCDSRQPRLLDLFINLQYDTESQKYRIDINDLPSLLDVAIGSMEKPSCEEAESCALAFCLHLFGSKSDYIYYLSTSERFWIGLMNQLSRSSDSAIPWAKKQSASYAADLISLEVLRRSGKSVLLAGDFRSHWIAYLSDTLPKIFQHLNRDVARGLRVWLADSADIQNVARFFASWTSMNILAFSSDSLKDIISDAIRQDTVRGALILLNRSIFQLSSSEFMHSVSSGLLTMLQLWQDSLSPKFFTSVLHIVEDFTATVCSVEHREEWNDSARLAVLKTTLMVLDAIVSSEPSPDISIKLGSVRNIFEIAVGLASSTGLDWNVRMVEEDEKGWVMGCAVAVSVRCIRLINEEDGVFTLQDVKNMFSEEMLYEVLLTKIVQLLGARRLSGVIQNVLTLLLLMSEHQSEAAILNQVGFSSCIALPLGNVFETYKEIMTERDVASTSIDDLVESRGRIAAAQAFFEVCHEALSVQFNIMRHDRQRFADSVKIVGAQVLNLPDILDALRGSPTLHTFRLVEILTRLIREISRYETSSLFKQACLKDIPLLLHLLCGHFVKRASGLTSNADEVSSPLHDAIMSGAVSCLQVLNASNPGISSLLTDEEYLSTSSAVKLVVDNSFGNPAFIELSPTLSFGTFVHVMKTAVEVLTKVGTSDVGQVVLNRGVSGKNKFGLLANFLERSADFFMYQVVAFAVGLSSLTGDRWQETLRELNNEIAELRNLLRKFLEESEDNMETSTLATTNQPKGVMELVTQIMGEFATFYEQMKEEYDPGSGGSGETTRAGGKKVTFLLSGTM